MLLNKSNPLNIYYDCNTVFEFKLPFNTAIQRVYKTRNIGKLYQASKTFDFETIEKIIESNVDDAILIGNSIEKRKDWDIIKKEVMLKLNMMKSKHEKRFREELRKYEFDTKEMPETEYSDVLTDVLKELSKTVENAIDNKPDLLNNIIDEVKLDIYKNIEILKSEANKAPNITIINTDFNNQASKSYIKSKIKELENNGIGVTLLEIDIEDLEFNITSLNKNDDVDFVILQLPLKDNKSPGYYLNMINTKKDIDKLNSVFYYSKNKYELPLTAQGLLEIINKLSKNINFTNILFMGNGLTTNRNLFMYMFDNMKEFDYRIINSKTSKTETEENIKWADLIISSTGLNNLKCKNKIVISPSIIKIKDKFVGDLVEEYKQFNLSHNTIGKLGKVTVAKLIENIFYYNKKKC